MKNSDKATCGDFGGNRNNGDPCERVAGWGTDFTEGKCKQHRGTSPDGESHKHNQNAQKHGLFALPEHLQHELDERKEDRYRAYFEALCSRYERYHGNEPDDFAKDRLSRVAIECLKERIADEYLTENAQSTILTQRDVREVDGRTIMVEKENHILAELTALKRETRLTLKDMGLLRDPESQKAESQNEVGELVKRALEE